MTFFAVHIIYIILIALIFKSLLSTCTSPLNNKKVTWQKIVNSPTASLMADQPTEAVNFTNDFPMVFNFPFWRRGNVRADEKVNVTFTHYKHALIKEQCN